MRVRELAVMFSVPVSLLVLSFGLMAASVPSVQQWKNGNEAFEKVCARCHTTGVGPEILGRDLQEDYVTYLARNGQNGMPSFPQSEIDDATLAQIAKYIAASKPAQ